MSAPAQLDENLRFLYLCLENSQGKDKIDWPPVATAMNLNVPAARMRFRRLGDKLTKGTDTTKSTEPKTKAKETSSAASAPARKKQRATKRKKSVEECEDEGKDGDGGEGEAEAE